MGVRRNSQRIPANIEPVEGDITACEKLCEILVRPFDIVVVTLSPSGFSEIDYRETYLQGARSLVKAIELAANKPRLLIWVSSTSVYGQSNGKWVDENSETQPDQFSGRILLQAEQLVRDASVPSVCVRFSGIYGPGRERLIRQVLNGEGRPAQPEQWSNRIHVDDCAGVLAHLIRRCRNGQELQPVYIASDCEPVTQHDLRVWLAEQLGVAITQEKAVEGPNRRCDNAQLLKSGYRFRYPGYREGYASLIGDLTSKTP